MASIAKRPNGQWRARYRDAAGKEHAQHFGRKVDAQRWLDEQVTALVTGQWVDPAAGRVTFSAFYARWSPRQVSWAPTTRVAMDRVARTVPFGDVPLSALRRSHIEQWVAEMHLAGLAPATIRLRVANARSILRAAVRDRVLATDPSEGVQLPRVRRAAASMSIPAPETVREVLDACEPRFHGLVAVCAFAGLRLGEAAALQVGDVDWLRRTVTVSRQAQRAGGGVVAIRPPKHGSERVVPLPDSLLDLLAAHVAEHCPGSDPQRWMFDGLRLAGRPGPGDDNAIGHRWRSTCKRAGVEGAKLHSLRHFYASGLISAGCDVVTVQRALGHHSASITLNVYSHLWPSGEDRTRRAAEGIATAVLGPFADQVRTRGTV
jgi:integrase